MTRAVLAFIVLAAPAAAQDVPALSRDPRITEGLFATAMAYEIGRVCPTLDGRRVEGLAFLLSLQAYARSQGFSQDEIDAYIDDEAEFDRLEGIARERLAGMGAVEGQPGTYCAVGQAEIAKGSQVGRLLRPS